MKPFKSRLPFFHPKRHIPAVNWTHDLNISPVEDYTFVYYGSMQNIQKITNAGGCNKYTIKYLAKIDEQNYVIVYTDGNKSGKFITKSTHLHNSKLSASKYNDDKEREKKRENSHSSGKAISLTEMIHVMLRYSEVATDLCFVIIATTPLEFRISLTKVKEISVEDGAEIGNICNNARISKNLPDWRVFTDSQLLILQENKSPILDIITEFPVHPPELC